MIWLLDSGPLDRLAQVAGAFDWSWPGALLHIAQMVECVAFREPCRRTQRALSQDPTRREQIPARFADFFE